MLINLDFNYRLALSHLIANYDPILQQTNNYYRCRVCFQYVSENSSRMHVVGAGAGAKPSERRRSKSILKLIMGIFVPAEIIIYHGRESLLKLQFCEAMVWWLQMGGGRLGRIVVSDEKALFLKMLNAKLLPKISIQDVKTITMFFRVN